MMKASRLAAAMLLLCGLAMADRHMASPKVGEYNNDRIVFSFEGKIQGRCMWP